MWPFGKTEHRADIADAIAAHLEATASGNGAPDAAALGAVETAAGLWARAFASATVTPASAATAALTPSTLASIGRQLAVRGEGVYLIDFDNGALVLQPATAWEIRGGRMRSSWRYRVELAAPGGVVVRNEPADAVVHVRYATRPGTPWVGVSPLGLADETRQLASWIERRLREEASTRTGYLLPLPTQAPDSLRADLKKIAGRLLTVDTVAGGWQDGKDAAPRGDWESRRLGASPPAAIGSLRQDVRQDVFGAYGIPNAVFGNASAAREAYRQFLASTISPLAKLVAEELSDKLDTPALAFTFEDMRAADIAGRARAYGVLINANMAPAEAAEATGLD